GRFGHLAEHPAAHPLDHRTGEPGELRLRYAQRHDVTSSCPGVLMSVSRHGDTAGGAGVTSADVASSVARTAGRLPKPLRIASSSGSALPARFARMSRSHAGSNFFQPPA